MKYMLYPFDDGVALELLEGLAPGFVIATNSQMQSPAIGLILHESLGFVGGLWNVQATDEVFVVGHAASGEKVLGSDTRAERIDQTEIVRRLSDCGLPRNVRCKIILWACESGQGGASSLASKVSQQLRNMGFDCADNVWGFKHKVGTRAHRISGHNEENLPDKGLWIQRGGDWVAYARVADEPDVLIQGGAAR